MFHPLHHLQLLPIEVQAEEMTLKIASYWLCGCGPRIMAEDFFSANFAEEGLAGSLPELLVTTLLSSVLANVLGRDVTRSRNGWYEFRVFLVENIKLLKLARGTYQMSCRSLKHGKNAPCLQSVAVKTYTQKLFCSVSVAKAVSVNLPGF